MRQHELSEREKKFIRTHPESAVLVMYLMLGAMLLCLGFLGYVAFKWVTLLGG